jgi:hypothetical protein
MDGLLLKCLTQDQAHEAIGEVHEGLCGSHQSSIKIRWVLRRAMLDDCVRYKKGCMACQCFGDVQLTPMSLLYPFVKPWLFRGWGLDFISKIHPSSSRGHRLVLVATDYFTKWTEPVTLRNMTRREVTRFVEDHIIHRFGVPQP